MFVYGIVLYITAGEAARASRHARGQRGAMGQVQLQRPTVGGEPIRGGRGDNQAHLPGQPGAISPLSEPYNTGALVHDFSITVFIFRILHLADKPIAA